MSKIQFNELATTKSELNLLSDRETGAVVGGYGYDRNAVRNYYASNINIATIVQVNNNINIQIAFNGDNYNVANLTNNAGANQG